MKSQLFGLSLLMLVIGVGSLGLPSQASAARVCVVDNLQAFWTLSNIPNQNPILAFGQVELPATAPPPWLVFGILTNSTVELNAINPDADLSGECCHLVCVGTRGANLIFGRCTNPNTECNSMQGCAGQTAVWNAQIIPQGTFPCMLR